MAYSATTTRRPIGAYGALGHYGRALGAAAPPPSGVPPLPKLPTSADALAYLQAQGKSFATGKISELANTARAEMQAKFNVSLPAGVPMVADQITAWTSVYLAANGLPDSPEKVAKMASSFITANSAQMGVSPELIAAVDLVTNMPTTAAEGVAWVENLGKRYAAQYGIPLSTDEIARCAARAACANFGVDPRLVDVGVEIFGSGKIDGETVEKIAVVAAATAGAIAFSALGIPAPIGSMIGSFIGQKVIGFAKDLFGPDDMDRQRKAYGEMLKARDIRQAQCVDAGQKAWKAYNEYWDADIAKLRGIINSPDLGPLLLRAGGVRFFGVMYDPNDQRFQHFCLLPGHTSEENPNGCPYFCTNTWNPKSMEWQPNCESLHCEGTYTPGRPLTDITGDINTQICDTDGSPVMVWPTDRAWQDFKRIPKYAVATLKSGGKVNGQIDPYALLRYYLADRFSYFPAPGAGFNTSSAKAIQDAAAMADPWVKTGIMYDCATPGVVEFLGTNVALLDKAMTFVMADIVKTVAWQSARDAAVAAAAARDAAARADLARATATAAQSIAAARATYSAGLTPAQLAKFNVCVKVSPKSRYASCRAAAGGDPIVNLATSAARAAQARVRSSRFMGRLLIGTVLAAGVVGVALATSRSRQGS